MNDISLYQIEMIQKNIVTGIVKMNIVNDEIKYDMNDLKSLKKIHVIHVIKIIKIIKMALEFFLYEKNFILDQGRIQIDKKGKICLLYVPKKEYNMKSMNIDAFIGIYIKTGYLRENLKEFIRSENKSYISFNIKKIYYLLLCLSLSLLGALAINKLFFFTFFPMILLPIFFKKDKVFVHKEQIDNRTIILSNRDKINVCFSDIFGNENSICIAEYENKYIGRDKKACSLYICNNTVGRKHARLSYMDGKIHLADNDSLNNTYVNNQKLRKNKQYEVKDGDRLMFADEEYMLFVKEK